MKRKDVKYTITLSVDGYEKTLKGHIDEKFFNDSGNYGYYTEEEIDGLIEHCINLDAKYLIRALHV